MRRVVRIMGTRGVPAQHGGFETFAERLALYLVENGWRVIVYCQDEGTADVFEDTWRGVERVHIPILQSGPLGTMRFDWLAIVHASKYANLCLTLGYNTAVFCAVLYFRGIVNLINMDGIEWARAKWGRVAKAWFWINERFGCWIGTHLIADHPEIKRHLATRVRSEKITTIAYGSDLIEDAPTDGLDALGLVPGRFLTLIARAEPENSVLEVVRAFSAQSRGITLVVLGGYDESKEYHRAVISAAGTEVRFLGPIYDRILLNALRFHSLAYVHGHQVGGTNPSLVEAMGAGNAIISHDNRFNRWVAGEAARYFTTETELDRLFDEILRNEASLAQMRTASRCRHATSFEWKEILGSYEALLEKLHPR